MAFNSLLYVCFLLIVLAVVHFLRRRIAARNAFLLACSYYFYACWDARFLALIFTSTVIDYLCGRALETTTVTRRRRAILVASVASGLAILGFFKYYNFFIDSTAQLLEHLGLHANRSSLRIILPVGISFYTFQSLSYTVDVYRRILATERRFINYALYVAFFPQLVAGPIERAKSLLPQIAAVRFVTRSQFGSGAYLILWGMFKKIVLADNVANFADASFAGTPTSAVFAVLGVLAFTIQIYCDFSAYSDIARGSARCMGFELMLNFNLPYFCTNVGDFYRRWHISLSTWLRDYLYIPLGGSRVSKLRLHVNLMTTMILGGLWHGAAWTFVLWGAYQGVLLSAHRLLKPTIDRIKPHSESQLALPWHWASLAFFVPFTLFGRLLFRAESPQQAAGFMTASFHGGIGPVPGWVDFGDLLNLAACTTFIIGFQIIQYVTGDLNVVYRFSWPVRGAFYAGLVAGIAILGEFDGAAFVYFQF